MRYLMKNLEAALSVKRSHGSLTEAAYAAALARQINPTFIDGAGNLHLDLRGPNNARTLFVAHTDTVSKGEGANPIVKDEVWWNSAKNSTLGADDGAGIALLLHLIRNKVPGYYIFCRGEECGGIGSSYLATEHTSLLQQFDRAIAFDRRGFSDVITKQGGRCCSDKFGEALAAELASDYLIYATNPGGVFTDTANFVEYVPECTNVSCGYADEHGDRERLHIPHFQELAHQIVKVRWEELPTVRDLYKKEPRRWQDPFLKPTPEDATKCKKLIAALEAANGGFCHALEELVNEVHSSHIRITSFNDADYHINELICGADYYEVLSEIYWDAGLRLEGTWH